MTELTDKNIIIVKDGDHSFISINGVIAKKDNENYIYKRKRKFVKENKLILNKSFEILKIKNQKILYNYNTGYWVIK